MEKEQPKTPKEKIYIIFNNQLWRVTPSGGVELTEVPGKGITEDELLWSEDDELAFQMGDMHGEV